MLPRADLPHGFGRPALKIVLVVVLVLVLDQAGYDYDYDYEDDDEVGARRVYRRFTICRWSKRAKICVTMTV
jgi:hypothetical protein